jgi:Laminin G domain
VRLLRTFLALRRLALVAVVLLSAAASAGVESAYGAWTAVARWEMNEGPSANKMIDSKGSHDGNIGNVVITGEVDGAKTGYRWPSGTGVKDDERLITVAGGLNPGRRAYAVSVTFRTMDDNFNIIQKGQALTNGGMWKLEIENGRARCLFRGSAGRGGIGSTKGVSLSNGAWHTVRCERRRKSVRIIVDGDTQGSTAHRTGRIANTQPVVIGGKLQCNPPNNSCEYYVGMLDRVVIRRRS